MQPSQQDSYQRIQTMVQQFLRGGFVTDDTQSKVSLPLTSSKPVVAATNTTQNLQEKPK